MTARLIATIAVLFALLTGSAGQAHTRSESHSIWTIDGRTVTLVYSVPIIELKKLTPNGALPSDASEASFILAHLWVSDGPRRCERIGKPLRLSADPVFHRTQIVFRCPGNTRLVLHATAFFDVVPQHIHLAQVQMADGSFLEQVFSADHQQANLSAGEGSPLERASFVDFVRMGIMHIFTGVDHMSFLLGLVLISRNLRDLVFVVTGFTIGHSVTLALAVTGILRPHAEYIDALVALTILLIGAENVAVATGRPRVVALGMGAMLLAVVGLRLGGVGALPATLSFGAMLFTICYLMISGTLRDAGRLRLIVTLVFGLIHGFGFAADLLEFKMPKQKLAELLVGFNVGVEIGQLTLVLTTLALVQLLRKMKLSLPRPIVVDVAVAGLAAVGTFWFISRSFPPGA